MGQTESQAASVYNLGMAKLSIAATDPNNPIVIADNDPRIADISNKANLKDIYTKNDIYNKSEVYSKNETYNKQQVYAKSDIDSLLSQKASIYASYTKTETDNMLFLKANSFDFYSKTEINSFLDQKANLNNVYSQDEVYTKQEIDNLIKNFVTKN